MTYHPGSTAKKSGTDFAGTVYSYAKTAIALFDTFIQCWNIKYLYNTARPETVINKYLDPDRRPHLQTTPFPGYTCGHCTISAACAESLTSIFGDHFAYTTPQSLSLRYKAGLMNHSEMPPQKMKKPGFMAESITTIVVFSAMRWAEM